MELYHENLRLHTRLLDGNFALCDSELFWYQISGHFLLSEGIMVVLVRYVCELYWETNSSVCVWQIMRNTT